MARGRRLLAKTVGLALGVALLAPAFVAVSASPARAEPGSEGAQFIAVTNELRVQHGLNPLATDGTLLGIARTWSGHMAAAGGISHNMNLPNMVSLPWQKLGENVGVGGSVDAIQTAFINSPHHYENLVDPVWNYVGIGVVDSGGRIWVTVDFMQLGGAPTTTAAPPVTTAPRQASTTQAAPVPTTAPDAAAPGTPEPATSTLSPTPALILALEQVRAADR